MVKKTYDMLHQPAEKAQALKICRYLTNIDMATVTIENRRIIADCLDYLASREAPTLADLFAAAYTINKSKIGLSPLGEFKRLTEEDIDSDLDELTREIESFNTREAA